MYLNDEALSFFEIEFILEERADAAPGSFRLIPHKYQPGYGRREGRFVYIAAVLRQRGFECTAYDVLGIQELRRMRSILDGYRKAAPQSFSLNGWDHNFELEMRWREAQNDVAIVGRFPPHPWVEHCASQDSMAYRRTIRLDVYFEFWLDPRRLDDPIDQLDLLLSYLAEEEKRQPPMP